MNICTVKQVVVGFLVCVPAPHAPPPADVLGGRDVAIQARFFHPLQTTPAAVKC